MPQKLLGMEKAERGGNVGPELLAQRMTRLCGRDTHAVQPLHQGPVAGIAAVG